MISRTTSSSTTRMNYVQDYESNARGSELIAAAERVLARVQVLSFRIFDPLLHSRNHQISCTRAWIGDRNLARGIGLYDWRAVLLMLLSDMWIMPLSHFASGKSKNLTMRRVRCLFTSNNNSDCVCMWNSWITREAFCHLISTKRTVRWPTGP